MLKKPKYNKPRRIRKTVCNFCEAKNLPDYKNPEMLRAYISERGKILSRDKTGTCLKHQRLIGREIKRARQLALLPFMTKI